MSKISLSRLVGRPLTKMNRVAPLCRGRPPCRLNKGRTNATLSTTSGVQVVSGVAQQLSPKTYSSTGFLILVFATTYLSLISAQGVANFSIKSTSYRCSSNVICLGNAHEYAGDYGSSGIEPGRLSLIHDHDQAGIAYYQMPVKLRDDSTGQPASFNTSFTVDVRQGSSFGRGDGMTFVISADNNSVGDAGGTFGIFNDSPLSCYTVFKSIVVEFDTYCNQAPPINDVSDNHVSFDFHNISYVAAANASDVNVFLDDTKTKYFWVEYSVESHKLEARVSYDISRPVDPLLNYTVNLFDHVEEFMWVGFSSASGFSYSNFYIGDWTFESYGIPAPNPIPQSTQGGPSARSPTPSSPLPTPSSSPSIPLLAAVKPALGNAHQNNVGTAVGVSVGILTFFVASFVILVGFVRWRRAGGGDQLGWKGSKEEPMMQLEGMPERFTYKQLSLATKSFSEEMKLGQGGFGSVYSGVLLSSGIPVAVKKISSNSNQGEKEFMAEVSIISQLRHRNLIQLHGWCKDASKGNYLLVYELMPNGSLDKVLFNACDTETASLSWQQRFNIVTGIAAAVDYLHNGWKQRVIHRDIKSSNIMLDEEWNAKLGDFGLARMVDHQRVAATTGACGTYGYIAPEAATLGRFTDKTDVFAFGAVVLEIACGRKAYSPGLPPEKSVLVDWVWQNLSDGCLLSAVDKRLGDYDKELMEVVLVVGLLCSHPNPLARPSMRHVVQVLAGDTQVPSIPIFMPAAFRSSPQGFPLDFRFRPTPNSESTNETRSGSKAEVPTNSQDSTQGIGRVLQLLYPEGISTENFETLSISSVSDDGVVSPVCGPLVGF